MKKNISKWFLDRVENIKKNWPQIITNEFIDSIKQNEEEYEMLRRWGVCYCDVSDKDFSQLDEKHMGLLTFNSDTIWPSVDKLPEGFNPTELIERGKSPMLNFRELHSRGITGKGVTIACIDSGIEDKDHVEIKDCNLEIVSLCDSNLSNHFHAQCVLANLCGKTLGVAPDVKVVHYECVSGGPDYNACHLKALEDILKRVKNGEEIKAINISGPLFSSNVEKEDYDEEVKKILNVAKELDANKCAIICSKTFGSHCLNFHCGHYSYMDDVNDINNIKMASWFTPEHEEHFKTKAILVCGGKVEPEWYSNNGYKYSETDCFSYTIPQATGLYALCLQVNYKLTINQFAEICHNTSTTSSKGYKVINPVKVVEHCKLLNK